MREWSKYPVRHISLRAMSILWNPCVGRLAGKKGTVWPDVCFASWVGGTPKSDRRAQNLRAASLPKAGDGSVCQTLCATSRELLGPEDRTSRDLSPLPLWYPLTKTSSGLNRTWQQTICSPGFQTWLWKEDPWEGSHIHPEVGKRFPWSGAGLMLAWFLLVHNKVTLGKGNKIEAFLDEKDPRIKTGSKGGAPGVG